MGRPPLPGVRHKEGGLRPPFVRTVRRRGPGHTAARSPLRATPRSVPDHRRRLVVNTSGVLEVYRAL